MLGSTANGCEPFFSLTYCSSYTTPSSFSKKVTQNQGGNWEGDRFTEKKLGSYTICLWRTDISRPPGDEDEWGAVDCCRKRKGRTMAAGLKWKLDLQTYVGRTDHFWGRYCLLSRAWLRLFTCRLGPTKRLSTLSLSHQSFRIDAANTEFPASWAIATKKVRQVHGHRLVVLSRSVDCSA